MPPLSFDFHHGERDPLTTTVGFTSSLMNTLVVSRSKMQQWAEFEKAKADKVAESYRLTLIAEQAAIDEQATNILSVQLERGLKVSDEDESRDNVDVQDNNIVTKKKDLEEEKVSLEEEISKLEQEFENREKRVSDTAMEENKQCARADEVRALKERVREAKQMTVDDLTRGIVNYKYLGMDFEKTKIENELRFFFSRLDPKDPARQFSFVLQVDDGDKYEIADCQPSIDAGSLFEITQRLNTNDDMSFLVRKMRRAFAESLALQIH